MKTYSISKILIYSCKGITEEERQKAIKLADAAPELLEALIRINARVPIIDPLTRKYMVEAIKKAKS